mgnify:CR=1 FL=1
MSVIYLRHPTHGTKVATSSLEAEYDEGNGWERYTLDTPSSVAEVAEPQAEAEAEVEAPDDPRGSGERAAEAIFALMERGA